MNTIYLYKPEDTSQCGYLKEERSSSLYTDPRIPLSKAELSHLSRLGFRRSGHVVYKPACPSCSACQSFRHICSDYRLSRSHKRLNNAYQSLRWNIEDLVFKEEIYQLFERYISKRHKDGDMYPPSKSQFGEFLLDNYGNSRFLCAYDDRTLVACIVIDIFDDGLSSVYSFFDPNCTASLGTHCIQRVSELCMALKLPYHYLGYYVANCGKMSYKRRFQPAEVCIDGDWQLFES